MWQLNTSLHVACVLNTHQVSKENSVKEPVCHPSNTESRQKQRRGGASLASTLKGLRA